MQFFKEQYFKETPNSPERIGKVIGDVFSVCVYVCVLVLMLTHFA
jgi:hypothetical protein